MTSSRAFVHILTAIELAIVPDGQKSAASLPIVSAAIRSSFEDGRVVAENVVADHGLGHGLPHLVRGPGDRIAPEIRIGD